MLDIPKRPDLGLGFIDDIAYGTRAKSTEENAEKLTKMLEKAEEWRKSHGAQFERSKYMLVHFTHK